MYPTQRPAAGRTRTLFHTRYNLCMCEPESDPENKQNSLVSHQNCFPFIVDSARTNANVTLAAAFTGLALAVSYQTH